MDQPVVPASPAASWADSARTEQLSFVTVTFEAEVPLLMLQARSMATFATRDLVAEIVVIDNTEHGIRHRQRGALLAAYGPLATCTRIVRPESITTGLPAASGWVRQQILKLMVSRSITTRQYVVLDAKNHLVAHPTIDFFTAPDGRARVATYSFVDHPLRRHLEQALRYTGLPDTHLDRFTATVTPFVLDTARVLDMIADVEQRSRRSFADEFVDHDLTEFFLYSAWVLASGDELDHVFADSGVRCPVVWPRRADVEGVEQAIAEANEHGSPFFSVHRRALATLDRRASTVLADFWVDSGIFTSRSQGRRFIRSFRATLARSHITKRLPRRLRSISGS